ncbi:MAG: hypothetical protein GX845_05620 [Erysipelothrix sp.]|jgi:copper chaperone CopZ|nr:hypothetical protein [Erysipelothrix sp.]
MAKKVSNRTKRTSIHWPTIVLIVSVVLLLIPTIAIGMMLLDAFEGTGSSQHGNRFTNERQYEITDAQVKDIETRIDGIDGVVKVQVNLKSATLRVNALVNESHSKAQVETLVERLVSDVFAVVAMDKYFSEINGAKQYDLEVHAYNNNNPDDASFIYYIANKNAVMEDVAIQLVSDPKNEGFVRDLYDKLYNQPDVEDEEENDD